MTTQQYDTLFSYREVFFDDRGNTLKHGFLDYFDHDRLDLAMGIALSGARGQAGEPRELREMDHILALPKNVSELRHWLTSPHLSSQMYALWRLEGILCGGSQHLADETLDKVHLLLRNTPREVWNARKTSACLSVRRGYWPTEEEMTRAGAPAWAKDS
jgi:hypothetical protein